MKLKYIVYLLLMAGLTSCSSSDDEDTTVQNGHWYIYETQKDIDETQADIKMIADAVLEGKQLDYKYVNKKEVPIYGNYIDFVGPEGRFDFDWIRCGDYGRRIKEHTSIIQIRDRKTVLIYECQLYIVNETSYKPLYKWYSGSVFGEMCYASDREPEMYAYVQEDNMILLSNGDLYFISEGALIPQGSSTSYRKFVPESY